MAQKTYIIAFCFLNALIPLLSIDMPRGMAFFPGVIGIAFFALYFVVFKEKPYISKRSILLALCIFGLSSISLIWAKYFEISLKQVIKLACLLPPQILLIGIARGLTKEQLKPYMIIFPYGVSISAIFLCFEIISGGMFFNLIRGDSLDTPVGLYEFNRATTIICLYSFPALAILKLYVDTPFNYLILFLPLICALILTESQSAQLSFVVGTAFLFLFPYRSNATWSVLKYTLLTLMLVAPFLAMFLYEHFAETLQNIPIMAHAYAGHRLEIWDYVSRYMLQSPLYGLGIEVTRATMDFDSGQIFARGNTTIHPHNFAIQLWIEFGLIGVLIAMGFIYKIFSMAQETFNTEQQRAILPSLMATMAPAAAAFGIWQGWWLGTLFHLTAICIIASKLSRTDAPPSKDRSTSVEQ